MKSLKGYLASFILLITILIINALQTASLVIKPFSSSLFRRVNRWFANLWWGLCDLGVKKLFGTEIIISGDELPLQENSIVVLNHQKLVDIPVIFRLANAKKRLGDLKWFVKDVLKYVPGVGWGMLFLDCLFIKRNWMSDQAKIAKTFENIKTNKIPFWLMTFAEGTRFTPSKLAQSQKFAAERGLVIPKHVLIPRTKGFVVSVESLRGHAKAVYDFTIGYEHGQAPSLWQWMSGDVQKVHLHVRRFLISDLPIGEKALSDWLLNLFNEKDSLLGKYYTEGSFV